MSVRIILEAYGSYWAELPKDFILQQMPGSIFAQALQDDPNAKEIVIPSRDVSPESLDVIKGFSERKLPPQSNPLHIRADRYLNYPILGSVGAPIYNHLNWMEINDPNNYKLLQEMKTEDEAILPLLVRQKFNFRGTNLLKRYAAGSQSHLLALLLDQPDVNPNDSEALLACIRSPHAHVENLRLLLDRIHLLTTAQAS